MEKETIIEFVPWIIIFVIIIILSTFMIISEEEISNYMMEELENAKKLEQQAIELQQEQNEILKNLEIKIKE